jgi:threonine/homoserine/homoserine lactone efflux protein
VENIVALIAATIVLILIPGPNVALIVANSLRHGMRIGIITSLGTTVGIAVQLLVVVVGMAALIELVADALTWIKWPHLE